MYPAVPCAGCQCAVWTDGRIRKAINAAGTRPATTSGSRQRSRRGISLAARDRAAGQVATATAATVATAMPAAIRLACRTGKPGRPARLAP